MRKVTKQLKDYQKLAQEKGLKFLGRTAPYSIRDSADYECLNCGRAIHTNYNNLQSRPNGCICQGVKVNGEDRYHELAESLGLKWLGIKLPQNVREITTWYSPAMKTDFEATYNDLGYGRIKKGLKKYVILTRSA